MTGRVLAYGRRPDPLCDVCGAPIVGDPCEPHSPSCPRIDHGVDDCDCDWHVHPECCWTCNPARRYVVAVAP